MRYTLLLSADVRIRYWFTRSGTGISPPRMKCHLKSCCVPMADCGVAIRARTLLLEAID
jgi:hypothetical protein